MPSSAASRCAVAQRDLGVHRLHLFEDVEVGCEARDRTVEEHHVLHEQHELLRRARAVLEQLLRELLQPWTSSSAESVVGSTVWSRSRSREHRVEVGVGRERTEVAQRAELAHRVATRRADEQHQERHALRLVEPAGDAEVHEHGAAVGLHHQVAAVQVAVEDAVQHRAFHEADEPACSTASVSTPASCIAATSSHGMPSQPFHHEHAPRDERRDAGAGRSSAR